VLPSELPTLKLYWQGPKFLRRCRSESLSDLPEVRVLSVTVNVQPPAAEWFEEFLSYDNLIRVVALVYRFIDRCHRCVMVTRRTAVTRYELDAALDALVIESQRTFFVQLRHELSHCLRVSAKPLARLCPFIRESYIL